MNAAVTVCDSRHWLGNSSCLGKVLSRHRKLKATQTRSLKSIINHILPLQLLNVIAQKKVADQLPCARLQRNAGWSLTQLFQSGYTTMFMKMILRTSSQHWFWATTLHSLVITTTTDNHQQQARMTSARQHTLSYKTWLSLAECVSAVLKILSTNFHSLSWSPVLASACWSHHLQRQKKYIQIYWGCGFMFQLTNLKRGGMTNSSQPNTCPRCLFLLHSHCNDNVWIYVSAVPRCLITLIILFIQLDAKWQTSLRQKQKKNNTSFDVQNKKKFTKTC